MPRRIFGPLEKVTGVWKKTHNVVFHNLYASPNIFGQPNQEE
jgi:hypothetical protein